MDLLTLRVVSLDGASVYVLNDVGRAIPYAMLHAHKIWASSMQPPFSDSCEAYTQETCDLFFC